MTNFTCLAAVTLFHSLNYL